MSMRDVLRAGLAESYRPKPLKGLRCVLCGLDQEMMSLHLLEGTVKGDAGLPSPFVLMSQSRGLVRGSFPVCTTCAPPCPTCGLPIQTKGIRAAFEGLRDAAPSGANVYVGSGYCRHLNFLLKVRGWRTQRSFINAWAPQQTTQSQASAKQGSRSYLQTDGSPTPPRAPRATSARSAGLPFGASLSGVISEPLAGPLAEERRQKILSSKPRREAFETDEEFEESLSYWMQRQGRALAQMETAQRRSFAAHRYEGDIGSLTGSILAAWFLANPNGPSLSALGILERPDRPILFYREMHFTGQTTWLVADARQSISDSGGDFGKVLLTSLERANKALASEGRDKPILSYIPSFVATNGNPTIGAAFPVAILRNLADLDWGRELYLLRKHRGDFFARAGEELREAYENMKADPTSDPQMVRFLKLRFGHIPTFADWSRPYYEPCVGTLEIILAWWQYASSPATVQVGASQFAEMWQGSAQQVSDQLQRRSRENDTLVSMDTVAAFFSQFGLPIFSPLHGVSD